MSFRNGFIFICGCICLNLSESGEQRTECMSCVLCMECFFVFFCDCVCACCCMGSKYKRVYGSLIETERFGTTAFWIEDLQQLATCRLLSITWSDTPASVIDGVYGNSTSITLVMGSWYCEWENVDGVKSTQLLLWIVSSDYPELTIYLSWWVWQSTHITSMNIHSCSSHTIWTDNHYIGVGCA